MVRWLSAKPFMREMKTAAIPPSPSCALMVLRTRTRALVTGVRFLDGMGYLMVGDAVMPLSAVVEVLGPSS